MLAVLTSSISLPVWYYSCLVIGACVGAWVGYSRTGDAYKKLKIGIFFFICWISFFSVLTIIGVWGKTLFFPDEAFHRDDIWWSRRIFSIGLVVMSPYMFFALIYMLATWSYSAYDRSDKELQ